MAGPSLQTIQITLLVLLLSGAAVANSPALLQTPYPILLVLAGLLFSFTPGMPRVTLDPDIVFFAVLPPLLYSAAWNTSWQDFRHNLITIAFLAIGLVAFTVVSVDIAAPFLFPGFDWRIGFVLGAVVATTDSIAATSIAQRIGLPKKIVDILEGESLVNDATGLLALEFGIAMVVNGQTPTGAFAIFRLLYLSLAWLAVGLMLAAIVNRHQYLCSIFGVSCRRVDPCFRCALGRRRGAIPRTQEVTVLLSSVRLQANAVWNALTFIINGPVFLVIGLQLPYVLAQIRGLPPLYKYSSLERYSVFS